MKKICFITTVSGTLQLFIIPFIEFINKQSDNDYNITVICNSNEVFKQNLPEFINYIPIKLERGIKISGIRTIIELYKIFKKNNFNLIQYSTPNASFYASIAGRLAKIKARLYCQWGIRYVGFNNKLKRKIFKCVEKIICKNSTWIEPDSFGNLEFSRKEKLYTEKNSSVILNGSANGIDLNKFSIDNKKTWNDEIRNKYMIKNDEIVIGFLGRIDKDKGINELLSAFQKIHKNTNKVKLFIIGPTDNENKIDVELYKWAKSEEDVIFTGIVKDVEKYYAAMDIFALPSYREGFGSVTIEAEAMGVPVIVTDIPGPREAMLNKKTGILVNRGDAESLENAMQTLIDNKELREKYGMEGIRLVTEKFGQIQLFKYMLKDRNRLIGE